MKKSDNFKDLVTDLNMVLKQILIVMGSRRVTWLKTGTSGGPLRTREKYFGHWKFAYFFRKY